jgi:glutathione S-transferase
MKLFYSPGACSLAPHIALQEAGLAHELEPVNLQTHNFLGGDFYKVNPKGYVPALQLDNGELLTEGAVIQQYVADLKPEKGLLPKAGTFERYRALEWLNYVATEMHKGWGPLWNAKNPAEVKDATRAMLGKKLDFLSAHLKDKQYLMGSTYTIADGYLFTILSWGPHTGMDIAKWPTLAGYTDRVRSRPAVQAALKAEGLLK